MGYTLITANRNYSSWSLRPWVLMTMLGINDEHDDSDADNDDDD